jgi:hypothetical protein
MGTLTKPPANIRELPLAQRAEMALKAAVEKVVEEHMRDGRPLYIAMAQCTRILHTAPLILITQCNRSANCDILTVKMKGKDGAL